MSTAGGLVLSVPGPLALKGGGGGGEASNRAMLSRLSVTVKSRTIGERQNGAARAMLKNLDHVFHVHERRLVGVVLGKV
jgi:hypothetical protein